MTGNLYEFLGTVLVVSAATFFVVGLRWAILKMDRVQSQRRNCIKGK